MKKSWFLFGASLAMVGVMSSCADPYYGDGYGGGAYPRNAFEAAVPIVVGAAVIGALTSNSRGRERDYRRGGYQFDERNWGGAYRGAHPGHCW